MKSIRWFSSLNPWIDVVAIIADDDVEKASLAANEAEDAFWNYEDECYGDALERKMREYEIEVIAYIYHDPDRTDFEYETQWEKLLLGIFQLLHVLSTSEDNCMKCDWCGNDGNVTRYVVTGKENGVKKKATIHICDCCSAWGVLSTNWYGLDERISIMTGIDYDYDDEGNLLMWIR